MPGASCCEGQTGLRTETRSRAAQETQRAGLAHRTTQQGCARNAHRRGRCDDAGSPNRAADSGATLEGGAKTADEPLHLSQHAHPPRSSPSFARLLCPRSTAGGPPFMLTTRNSRHGERKYVRTDAWSETVGTNASINAVAICPTPRNSSIIKCDVLASDLPTTFSTD